jgi:hypothetical protein
MQHEAKPEKFLAAKAAFGACKTEIMILRDKL